MSFKLILSRQGLKSRAAAAAARDEIVDICRFNIAAPSQEERDGNSQGWDQR